MNAKQKNKETNILINIQHCKLIEKCIKKEYNKNQLSEMGEES